MPYHLLHSSLLHLRTTFYHVVVLHPFICPYYRHDYLRFCMVGAYITFHSALPVQLTCGVFSVAVYTTWVASCPLPSVILL